MSTGHQNFWNYSKSQRHTRLASSIQKLVDIEIEINAISKGVDDRSLRSISKDYYQIGHLLKLTMLMSQSISTREQKNLAQMQGPCGVDGTFHSWSLVALVVRMLIATAIRPFLKQPILSIAQFTSRRVRCKCGGTSEQYLLWNCSSAEKVWIWKQWCKTVYPHITYKGVNPAERKIVNGINTFYIQCRLTISQCPKLSKYNIGSNPGSRASPRSYTINI